MELCRIMNRERGLRTYGWKAVRSEQQGRASKIERKLNLPILPPPHELLATTVFPLTVTHSLPFPHDDTWLHARPPHRG